LDSALRVEVPDCAELAGEGSLRTCFSRPFLSEKSTTVEIRKKTALNAISYFFTGTSRNEI